MAKQKKKVQAAKATKATKAATEFEKIIHEGRERSKNEVLANEIFTRNRRKSAPAVAKSGAGPSLASRVGVNKKRATSTAARSSLPAAGNINSAPKGPKAGSLASRITKPGQAPNGQRTMRATTAGTLGDRRRTAQLASALERADTTTVNMNIYNGADKAPLPTGPRAQQQQQSQRNFKEPVSIKGLAGPFAILAQNFAPGTTAADIESAMTPVGGEMLRCVVLKTHPFILVEMVFASREGGDRVIEMFNDAPADGRILKVYPKPGGYTPTNTNNSHDLRSSARIAPAQIVDGTRGFPEETTGDRDPTSRYGNGNGNGSGSGSGNSNGGGNGRLYSDRMVSSKRGRGFRGDWTR